MVKLLETARVIVFFFFYHIIYLLRFFLKRSFVFSSEHENNNVATIGTLLDQFMLAVNKNVLLAFHSVSHVLDRDKTRRLGKKML